jgi:hypothetical protein
MTMETLKRVGVILVLGLSLGILGACEEQGPAEEIGEAVDDTADNVGDALEDAGDEVEDAVN